jgi:hypothetical protein
MNIPSRKIFFYRNLLLTVIAATLLCLFYLFHVQSHDSIYYMSLLKDVNKNYVETIDHNIVDNKDMLYLQNCSDKSACFGNFYQSLAKRSGAENAFRHLQKVVYLSNYDFSLYCNVSTFAIGKGQFKKGGLVDSLLLFSESEYFSHNQCLVGYLQGLVVEFLKSQPDKKTEFSERVDYVCGSKNTYRYFIPTCIQGVGNFLAESTKYDILKSLNFCDKLGKFDSYKENCYFGVFISYRLKFNSILKSKVEHDIANSSTGHIGFCENLSERYRAVCYMDMSRFLKAKDRNEKKYAEVINSCKFYKEELYRLACIKYNVRASVNDGVLLRLTKNVY